MEKNIFFVFDCLDFVEYLLKCVKLENELVYIDDRNIEYILIFYIVKEKMVEILKNVFSEIKVVVILDIFDSIK